MSENAILIIDDEPQICRLLEILLQANQYRTVVAQSGKLGIQLAASHAPDLIILDLGLPDISGENVLKELRSWYTKPILILSVQQTESDIVGALDAGADDYLTKPFRNAELLARIRVLLRRNQTDPVVAVYESGDLKLDYAARQLFIGQDQIKLTSTEYRLLCLFLKNEGRVLTHQFILKEIWGPGYIHETQYLRVFIASLRRKISPQKDASHHILTESGVGYRFV